LREDPVKSLPDSQRAGSSRAYDLLPRYPFASDVSSGWPALCACLPADSAVIAVDGPAMLDWQALVTGMTAALMRVGVSADVVDMRHFVVGWDEVLRRTASAQRLRDDPDFATLAAGSVRDLFDQLPVTSRQPDRLVIVVGPGAALTDHDVLWYADLPKRYAEAAIASGCGQNLGQPSGAGCPSARRLFYVDWPMTDRHRDTLAARIDYWIDMRDSASPSWATGQELRRALHMLSEQPFRTRPVFNSTPWGGHWAQAELGFNPHARNTALGYELIAPESGLLVGTEHAAIEVPLQLLVSLYPTQVLGSHVRELFGTSFPIRFDYLDTVGGGNLSVHCHPVANDMAEVFGWPYPQHETYYVMAGGKDSVIYLGLRADVSLDEFHRCARQADEHGVEFDIGRFVQTFPAEQHQLFMVPAGTPHGSGAGNVVLEISATPYLYSLRFYDWLRQDKDGTQRPVHVEHAFRNLTRNRRGHIVRHDLVQRPRITLHSDGWHEELLGSLPEVFFEVRRLAIAPDAQACLQTGDRFHVLNLVDGDEVTIYWKGGSHHLSYAETIVIPAAVGSYRVVASSRSPARIVQAVVR
jgi:mannose-6-phosphate isomerase class I